MIGGEAHPPSAALRVALGYASHNLHVIPAWRATNGICACPAGRRCKSPGKHPAIANWQNQASVDGATITRWFSDHEAEKNVGIVCGASHLVVIDVDPRNRGDWTFAALERELGPLPATVAADSGGGGTHLLFRRPSGDLRSSLGEGVDLLHDAKQFLVEPSMHPSGRIYRWRPGRAPGDVDLAELPTAWLAAARPKGATTATIRSTTVSKNDDFYETLKELDQGELLLSLSGSDLVAGQKLELGRANARGHRGLIIDGKASGGFIDEHGRIAHADKGTSSEGPDGGPYVTSWLRHYGNSDVAIRRRLPELVPALERFHISARAPGANRRPSPSAQDHDGGGDAPRNGHAPHSSPSSHVGNGNVPPHDERLDPDGITITSSEATAMELARLALRKLGLGSDGHQTIARWAESWWRWRDGHHRRLDDEALRSEVWILLSRISVETFDKKTKEPELKPLGVGSGRVSEVIDAMNAITDRVEAEAPLPSALKGYAGPDPRHATVVRNGVLDPKTGVLYPPTPKLFATAGAAVDYDPEATCPNWDRFVEQIFTDPELDPVTKTHSVDRETIRLLHQVLGWLISGDNTRHKIPLFVGPPRSGKSTIGTVTRKLLGEGNVCAPSLASLADSRFGLAPLLGKSLALVPDARLGNKIDQSTVAGILLAISGHDVVNVDRKRRDALDVRLPCRIAITSNELPRVADQSGALASRFLIVETLQSFAGKEDLYLEDRLHGELSGILNRALDGWKDLVTNGWAVPARAKEALDELERLGASIKAFIADRAVLDTRREVKTEDLFAAWKSWCNDNNIHPSSKPVFCRDLKAAFPSLKRKQKTLDGRRDVPTYVGIGLCEPWERAG